VALKPNSKRNVLSIVRTMSAFKSEISSPTSYAESQALGKAMRDAGIDAFAYFSARDPKQGVNVGIFRLQAFSASSPIAFQAWKSFSTQRLVEIVRTDGFSESGKAVFSKSDFEISGILPAPAV
jgi:hypothetical protein